MGRDQANTQCNEKNAFCSKTTAISNALGCTTNTNTVKKVEQSAKSDTARAPVVK